MSLRTKLDALKPEILSRVEEGRQYRKRYGRSPERLWSVPVNAQSCRLDLLPPSVDVLGGIVLDIGANVGDWTGALLSVIPEARVLAVEPAGEPLQTLRRRFDSDARVEVAAVAVSDTSGVATFHLTGHTHNASLKVPRDMSSDYGAGWEAAGEVEVPTVTLDELAADRPVSLVKIDVQGAEEQVLAGGSETLSRAQAVLLEVNLRSHYEGDLLFPDLHVLMCGHGYELADTSRPRKNAAGEALWMDACYLPER